MCGIIGYVGTGEAVPVLLAGLRRLEYRGYDSAGLAVLNAAGIEVHKSTGRIDKLAELVAAEQACGLQGISHTRWATHGGVSNENAHPHLDASGKLALVHNGVIENYQQIKERLSAEGHRFLSATDTEVLAHLIGRQYDELGGEHGKDRLLSALRLALREVSGTYGIAIMHEEIPGLLVGARRGSPLVVGVGQGEQIIASDVSAMLSVTQDAIYLNDYDIVALTSAGFEVTTLQGSGVDAVVSRVDYTEEDVSKGTFPHFMLKEIYEQPEAIENALRGRLNWEEATAQLGGLNMRAQDLRDIDRIIIAGCGTARHAGLVGEYIIEQLAHIPVEVEYASELRYRNMPLDKGTLVFVISQSGETADTLAALRESRRKGLRTLGICNNVGSTIARESDGGVYMHAGPEIGVAATKSFTSQVMITALIGLLLGRIRWMSSPEGISLMEEMQAIPDKMRQIIKLDAQIKKIAEKYCDISGLMFLGRLSNYPVALEGALKMKEISYLHAEGHPSAELKHGVIALIEEALPTIVVAPDDAVFEKNLSNMEEVKARCGPIIAIGNENSSELSRVADDVIQIPATTPLLAPLLTVVPLQMLAYHMAVLLGRDVDKPRNLAKSVTVE